MLLSAGLLAASAGSPVDTRPAFDLQLVAPPECPNATHVTAAVKALVHDHPAEPLVVRATIERHASGYTLEATLGEGQRQLQGETCDAVTQALIAITALAIDPSVRLSAAAFPDLDPAHVDHSLDDADAASPGPPTTATTAAILPRPPSVRPRADAAEVRERASTDELPRFGASLLGLGEWGALPAPSYGASGYLRVSFRAWSAEAGGAWLRPRWVQVPDALGRKGGYVSWLSLQGNGCRSFGSSAAACGGFEVGQMKGDGEGVAHEDSGRTLWLAAAVSALGRLPLGDGFALEARATAAFPLYRPAFSIEPYDSLHRPNWLSGRVSLGLGFR